MLLPQFIKKSNIYKHIILLIFMAEVSIRGLLFTPFPQYCFLLLACSSIIIASVTAKIKRQLAEKIFVQT